MRFFVWPKPYLHREKEISMKPANAISIPQIERAERLHSTTQPKAVKRTDLAQSDVGFFFLLTLLLIGIGRVMGAWILSDQVRIQKGPNEYVSRTEEYQNLHNQVGPNSFFRMF
jgi:hypothetical protein